MIWLIGNKGLLGQEIEKSLYISRLNYIASDIEIDIRSLDAMKKFIKDKEIKWIINCAAYTAVDDAEEDRDSAFEINFYSLYNIVLIAGEMNATLIHFSTDYIFSEKNNQDEFSEEDEPEPVNIYGFSKLAGEKLIRASIKKFFIIRLSWLFGKYKKNFVLSIIKLIQNYDEIKVVNDQWGSPTYTKEVASFILLLIAGNDQKNYGIYHFSSDGKITWFRYAKTIYKLALKHNIIQKKKKIIAISSEEYNAKAVRPKNSYLSKIKIKNIYKYPVKKWDQSLKYFFKKDYFFNN